MAAPSDQTKISATDISDAYAYHMMLAEGPGKDSDTDSSMESEELDSSDFGPETGDEEEEEEGAEEDNEEEINEKIENMIKDFIGDSDDEDNAPSTFPVFLLTLKTKLTLPAFGLKTRNKECPNSKFRSDMWLSAPNVALKDLRKKGLGFLDQIGQLCIQAKIRECTNENCIKTRQRMEKIAPKCDWEPFRQWALVAMSCQACLTGRQKLTRAHTHIASAVYGCCTILKKSRFKVAKYFRSSLDGPPLVDGSTPAPTDLADVCNILSWMMVIQDEIVAHPDDLDGLDRKFLPPTLALPEIENAADILQQLGICKNRLWNLVTLSERQENDLPYFMQPLILHSDSFKYLHGVHEFCTPTKCQRSQIDSTTVGQMHKCQDPVSCKTRTFNVDLLETSLDLGKGTAWSRLKPCLSRPNEAYIAISHVWSDGTGVGVKNAGCVNECLFDYFAQVAEDLECTGIWWDALSIPQESKARSKALNKMHSNYANAKTTVVHDNYLVNFPWKDDGSPCLALVLSSWFTRGWTALELIMSRRVKVLFKDPAGGTKPIIKDLDDDVLAHEPGSTTRAHWLVSGFIRRLRKPIDELSDLLAILKARSTSWARDRTIIAALLLNVPDCDFTRVEGEITRSILTHLAYIPFECLFHGSVTMADSGPWSWCVPTLDEIRLDLSKKMRGIDKDYDMLVIDQKGAVKGQWGYRRLVRKEIGRLEPYGENLAVRVKVKTALRHWNKCLLLRQWDSVPGPVLLVTTVGVTKGGMLECRYVGRVTKKQSEKKADDTPAEDDNDDENDDNANGDDNGEEATETSIKDNNEQETTDVPDDGDNEKEATEAPEEDDHGQGTTDAPAKGDNDNDSDNDSDESELSSKIDSDISSESSEGSEDDEVDIDDDLDVDWDMDDIRIGNDVTYQDGKPAVLKPPVLAKLAICGLNKIWTASVPEDDNADEDVDEDADENDSDLESLSPEKFQDDLLSSDDESSTDPADATQSASIKTPWFSQVEEYRRSVDDLTFDYDMDSLEPDDAKVRHLFNAIKAENKEVIRHLIKNGTDLPAGMKENLISILDPHKNDVEEAIEKLSTLGDVYYEAGRLEDAQIIHTIVTDEFDKKPKTRASTERLKSMHLLGRIAMKLQNSNKAERLFKDVLNLCQLKDKKKDAKLSAKIKASESKAKTVPQDPTKGPSKGMPKDSSKGPSSQLKRASTFKTSSKTTSDSKTMPDPTANPTSKQAKSNEVKPDQKTTKWRKVELSVLADLCLLYAEIGEHEEAAKVYQRALKSYGRASTSVDAFKNIWGIEIDELEPEKRREQYEKAEETYLYTLKRLEGERQVGKEHRLTLITVLNLAIVYELRKKYQEAEILYKRARNGFENEKEIGKDHILTLSSIHRLAVVSTILEKLQDTEKLYQLALDGVEKRYGPYHRFTFTVVSDFGNHYLAKGSSLNARRMFQRVMNGDNTPYHPYPELRLAALRDIAKSYVQQNELLQAEKRFESALDGLKAIPGQTLAACSTAFPLGVLYEGQGNLDKAESMFRYCMEEYQRLFGVNDTETLKAVRKLGLVQEDLDNITDAEKMLRRAYEGYMEIEKSKASEETRKSKDFIFSHPDTFEAARNLGSVCINLGKLNEAEGLCCFAHKGLKKALGPDDLSTLMTLRSLGNLYFKQLRLGLSKEHFEEALKGLETKTTMEADQELRLRIITELGITCARIGKYEEAKKLYEQAITGFETMRSLKSNRQTEVHYLIAVLKLGDLYSEEEMVDRAKTNILRAHKGFNKILGPRNPHTLEAVLSLGKLKNQSPTEVKELLEQALNGFEKVVGPNDMRTLDASATLGYLYNEEPQAVEFLNRAIDGYKKQPIPNHPLMLEAMYRLGVVYKNKGRALEGEKMLKDAIAGFEERFGPDHAVAFRTVMRLRFPPMRAAEFSAPVSHCAPPPPALTPRMEEISGLNATAPTSLTGKQFPIRPSRDPVTSSTKGRRDRDQPPTANPSSRYISTPSIGGNQNKGQPSTPSITPKYTASTSSNQFESSDRPSTTYTKSQYTPPASSRHIESRDKPSTSYNPSRDMSRSPLPRNTAKETKSRNIPSEDNYSRNVAAPYVPPTYTSPPSRPRNNFHEELQSYPFVSNQSSQDIMTRELPQWNRRDGSCSVCSAKFSNAKDFERHKRSCPGETSSYSMYENERGQYGQQRGRYGVDAVEVKCPKCQAVLWSEDELKHHTREKHESGYGFQDYSSSSASFEPTPTPEWNDDRTCKRCHQPFASRNDLFRHLADTRHDLTDDELGGAPEAECKQQ